MSRRRVAGWVVALLGLSGLASSAQAQAPYSGVNDPFFLYYGFYLPRQQAQALQPGPEATLNALTAARQSYAATNRSDMFDPNSSNFNRFESESDFLGNGRGRTPGTGTPAARVGGNLAGRGVAVNGASRFGRVGGYHPALRSGQSRNANLAVIRGGRGGLNGAGAAGIGSTLPNVGVPGPR